MVETTSASPRPLVYAHLSALHITDAKARNYVDFLAMLAQLEVEGAGQLDIIYSPGDVADNSQPAQVITGGDHDMEPGRALGRVAAAAHRGGPRCYRPPRAPPGATGPGALPAATPAGRGQRCR